MSSQHNQLLTACADGNLERLQELHSTQDASFEAMMLKPAEKGHFHIVQYCLEHGAQVSEDVITEASEQPEVFKILVTLGGLDVNHDFETAGDMLINAVWEGNRDFARWLLEHGADPNSGHLMADSTSAITAAAERGSIDLVEQLIKHDTKISRTEALPAAAGKGHLDMVQYLVEKGRNIDEIGVHDYGDRRKKKYEGTALHKAAAGGKTDIVKLLLDRGAKTGILDPTGRTPLERAREDYQQETVRLLASRRATS